MKFDSYSLKARLSPAFLVLLPVLLAVAAWLPLDFSLLKSLGTFTLYCGLLYLLAELGRDQGRKKQPALYQLWGGKPTVRFLRHRDASLDSVTKARYHSFLSEAIGKRLPSATEEKADAAAADAVYESAGNYLLEQTRDESKFPLVLKENTSYGFRRNLWGMKPAGIFICLCSLMASLGPACLTVVNARPLPNMPVPMAATIVVLLVVWLFRVNPEWVRLTSEAYALRLLSSCDQLSAGAQASKPPSRIIT